MPDYIDAEGDALLERILIRASAAARLGFRERGRGAAFVTPDLPLPSVEYKTEEELAADRDLTDYRYPIVELVREYAPETDGVVIILDGVTPVCEFDVCYGLFKLTLPAESGPIN